MDLIAMAQAQAARFWAGVQQAGACWLHTGPLDRDGYARFALTVQPRPATGPKQIHFRAHRFAWLVTHGDPGDLVVCHHCDVRTCVNPVHLWLGTHAENIADRDRKGRQVKGTRHPRWKHGRYAQP